MLSSGLPYNQVVPYKCWTNKRHTVDMKQLINDKHNNIYHKHHSRIEFTDVLPLILAGTGSFVISCLTASEPDQISRSTHLITYIFESNQNCRCILKETPNKTAVVFCKPSAVTKATCSITMTHMSIMASQIICYSNVCSTACLCEQYRNINTLNYWSFARRIHWWIPLTKGK